jgi:hypothetical protein
MNVKHETSCVQCTIVGCVSVGINDSVVHVYTILSHVSNFAVLYSDILFVRPVRQSCLPSLT